MSVQRRSVVSQRRAAVRAARTAAAMSLSDIADAAGVTIDDAVRHLGELRRRGRCAELVFDKVASPRDPFTWVDDRKTLRMMYAHPASPRGVLRVLSADRLGGLDAETPASTTARWAGPVTLEHLPAAAPRAAMIAAAKSWAEPVRRRAVAAADCPPLVLARIADADNSTNMVVCDVAANPGCPPATLAALCCHDQTSVRTRVVIHPRSPVVALRTIFETDPVESLRAFALPGVATPRRVAAAAVDSSRWMRCEAAAHPAVPERLLERLSSDPQEYVRAAAAANTTCPPHTMAQLATDTNPGVRTAVAANAMCSPRTMARLATDTDPDVRTAAAANAMCPVAEIDLADSSSEVLAAVAARADCPDATLRHLAAHPAAQVRAAVAANAVCPVAEIDLADSSSEVLAAVAARADCPDATLRHFAAHPAAQVRIAAAANPRVDVRQLVGLTKDTDQRVVAIALSEIRRRALTGR